MKTKHLLSLLDTAYTTVGVKFEGTDKPYTYKTRETFVQGDKAVVMVSGALKIVTIVAVHNRPRIDTDAEYAYKWIVSKVELARYEANIKAEQAFLDSMQEIERIEQQAKLKKQLADSFLSPEAAILLSQAQAAYEASVGTSPVTLTHG